MEGEQKEGGIDTAQRGKGKGAKCVRARVRDIHKEIVIKMGSNSSTGLKWQFS